MYTGEKNSPAKKTARVLVYDDVRGRYEKLGSPPSSALILPGRVPQQEIALARELLGASVTAVDVDQEALDAARAAGADNVILGGAEHVIEKRRSYSFINLDTCATVTSEWVAEAVALAAHAAPLVATWFSYGRGVEKDYHLPEADRYQLERQFGRMEHVHEPVRNRLCFIWKRAMWSKTSLPSIDRQIAMRPLRIWVYNHGPGARMFAVMWATDPAFFSRQRIEVVSVSHDNAHAHLSCFTKRFGEEKAFKLFDCDRSQEAAWKAMRTRGAKKKAA